MGRVCAQKLDMHALNTIYCGFFLAIFVLGAICGYHIAVSCRPEVLWSYWSAYLTASPMLRLSTFAAARYCVVLYVFRRTVFGAWLLPFAIFSRAVLISFCVSSYYLAVPFYAVPRQVVLLWLCDFSLLVPMLLLGRRAVLCALAVYTALPAE